MNAMTRRAYRPGDRIMAEHPEFGWWSRGTIIGVASMGPGGTSVWVEFDTGERYSLPLTDIHNLDKTEREAAENTPIDEEGLPVGKESRLVSCIFGLSAAVILLALVLQWGARHGWFR